MDNRDEKGMLLIEIRRAHLDWVTAQRLFDYVIDQDQIDYVIYLLAATEMRYEMLLRVAKRYRYGVGDFQIVAKGVS